jgi:small-conductance mechanosensitive channel
MPSYIVAESFVSRYDDAIRAMVTVLVVIVLLALVNRWIARRGERIASAVAGGELRPEAATRLRFLRRVVDATIVVIGLAVALSNFTALDRLMGTVLASSAIAAAVIGFAARQTLANAIAGLLLAITQPLRIGDHVTFEGETGVVEDVRLTYTWLRSGTDARIIVPNERLAAGVLRNDSIVHATVGVEASIWLAAEDDALSALDALRESLPGTTVRVAETTPEGVRLLLVGEPVTPGDRAVQEAVLREAALRALRDTAVSATP